MEPEVQENERPESVTGRDGYIVARALYEAIKYLSTLPEQVQPWSEIQDMKLMLEETCDAELVELFVAQDKAARLTLEGKVSTVFPSWERRPFMEKPPRRALSPADRAAALAYRTPPNLDDFKDRTGGAA